MICPLLTTGMYADPTIKGDVTCDCYESRCAWWDADLECCDEKASTLHLKRIANALDLIVEKGLKITGGINTHPY